MSARIDSIQKASNGVYISFTVSGAPDFVDIEGSPTVTGIYREEQNVEIASVSPGVMRAFVPISTDDRFFRIRLLPAGTNTLLLPIEAQNAFGAFFVPTGRTPFQQIYAAAEFSDASADVIDIHGVALRLDQPMTTLDVVVKRLTIRLGLYPGAMEDLPSRGFIVPDLVLTVFDRQNIRLTGTPGDPPAKAFDLRIPFDSAYRYDRKTGQLVMHMGEISVAGTGFNFDSAYPTPHRGIIYLPEPLSGPKADHQMIITKFLYMAVPEP